MAEKSDKTTEISKFEALGFVWEVFMAIALPTTACAFAGRWADARFQTSPWLTLLGLFIALALSGLIISRQAMQFSKRLKKTNPPT